VESASNTQLWALATPASQVHRRRTRRASHCSRCRTCDSRRRWYAAVSDCARSSCSVTSFSSSRCFSRKGPEFRSRRVKSDSAPVPAAAVPAGAEAEAPAATTAEGTGAPVPAAEEAAPAAGAAAAAAAAAAALAESAPAPPAPRALVVRAPRAVTSKRAAWIRCGLRMRSGSSSKIWDAESVAMLQQHGQGRAEGSGEGKERGVRAGQRRGVAQTGRSAGGTPAASALLVQLTPPSRSCPCGRLP